MLLRDSLLVLASALMLGGRCGSDPAPAAPPPPPASSWKLVWADEFDGPAGQAPDASKWGHDTGGSGWGNGQLEYDSDRPQNAALDGQGHLAITALNDGYGGRSYSSARLNTSGKFSHGPGRFEARLKLPPGRGLWPAFWLLGDNFGSSGWPACGEIDIMEYRGQEPTLAHGSVHGPGYSGGNAITAAHGLPGNAGFDGDFHVFSVDWTGTRIDFRVDDTVYQSIDPARLPPGGRWVFDHPFIVILDLAVGGGFIGPPDATTPFPAVMLVDYVRVYELAP